jgi:hypothetical protein
MRCAARHEWKRGCVIRVIHAMCSTSRMETWVCDQSDPCDVQHVTHLDCFTVVNVAVIFLFLQWCARRARSTQRSSVDQAGTHHSQPIYGSRSQQSVPPRNAKGSG